MTDSTPNVIPEPESTDATVDGSDPERQQPTGLSRRTLGAALLVAVIASLALAPVRGWAAQFLGAFRVNEIRAVPYDPAAMAELEKLAEAYEDVIVVESVDGVDPAGASVAAVSVPDLDAAAEVVAFPARLPQGAPPSGVRVEPGGELVLKVDGVRLSELAAELGVADDAVPAETGRIVVRTEAGYEVDLDDGRTTLRAIPAPMVEVPAGWDVDALGELFLAGLGMRPAAAAAVAATIDWGSTLVVPVPMGRAEAMDVAVDGVYGVYFDAHEGVRTSAEKLPAGKHTDLIVWQRDGVIYALTGSDGVDSLVAAANSLD